jgi:hypothetical protein
MSAKPGERVGAICGETEDNTVEIFGYGVFNGYEVPPPGVKFMGIDLHEVKHENPKITLDNGQVVWGCECWWGPEAKIQQTVAEAEKAGKKIVTVDIEAKRKGV